MKKGIVDEILKLKAERKAIILAHNYQLPEVQDLADYVGDSLGLSIKAAESDAAVVVLCGVRFMAETASILCPDKTVLMPDPEAGCPMANMITAENVRELKLSNPGAECVAYVNTSAAVKAEVDLCCTSSNAVKVVSAANSKDVIFIPDKYLGQYVASKVDKNLILWNGYCPTHVRILPEDITREKKLHPKARVMVHPECTPGVIALADEVLSTGDMCKFALESKENEFIIGTEVGILYKMRKENPQKKFYPASDLASCPNMKRTTAAKVLSALENMEHEVRVSDDLRKRALKPIQRMLELK
jgi:quinolinate synthase